MTMSELPMADAPGPRGLSLYPAFIMRINQQRDVDVV